MQNVDISEINNSEKLIFLIDNTRKRKDVGNRNVEWLK